ncbi:unnamed protein product [Polarella glacialis]|uniref:GH16 domain-containing protein n=1 Tax=Polarella glacialis TaxID=89957 RepID=A0A813LRJ8_POLGL|nr:unnamed protein product [Polarella glacialis]
MTPVMSRAVILCTLARLSFVSCTSSNSEESASLSTALETDDQCAAGDDDCALNALQMRGNAMAQAGKEGEAANQTEADANMEAYWSENFCFAAPKSYGLAFKAQGSSFFDDFTFMTVDETHGAHRYLTKEEALKTGVVETSEEHGTILRVGDVEHSTAPNAPFKRQSVMLHSNHAWKPSEGMLVVMKYNHVPYGAGVWPAFWLMNSDILWPQGGEFDILEYANDEVSKVTFHTNRNCMLDQHKLGQCMQGKPTGGPGPSNCNTDYSKNRLGCRPRQVQRSGEWFAKNPGVMAAAWDADGVTVYHIPNAEIPADLSSDTPKPETWGRFVLAYVPLDRHSCADIAKPQEIVLNIALCGDWAGGAWLRSSAARRTGYTIGCSADISYPPLDCCTKFVTSNTHDVNGYMKHQAYFSIDYMKVFTPADILSAPPLESATFKRGGVPLRG